jgi:predicted Zn-dependent peptidase
MDANAETLPEFVYFYSVCKPDKVEQAIAIEAERMRTCVFEAAVLRLEREKALAEVANVGANPAAQAWAKLQSLAYPKSREGLPKVGSEEPMKAATLEEAKAFYDAWYRPNNAVLVVYGAVDIAKAKEAIAAKFGVIKKAELPKVERGAGEGGGRAEVKGEPRQVLVGWTSAPAGTKEKAALLVATYVLRVQRGDVHKKAKQVMFWDDPFVAGRSLVTFVAAPNDGVEPDDVAAAAQAWVDGLVLDAKKLDAAKANLRNDLAGNDAFQLGFVNRKDEKKYGQVLAQVAINRVRREIGGGLGDVPKHAEALEVEDVKAAVAKYLAKEKAAVVIVR